MADESLVEGLYEELITKHLSEQISRLVEHEIRSANVDEAEQPTLLSRHVARAVERALHSTKDPERRIDLVNSLVALTQQDRDLLSEGPRRLLGVSHRAGPGLPPPLTSIRPATPLAEAA